MKTILGIKYIGNRRYLHIIVDTYSAELFIVCILFPYFLNCGVRRCHE